MENWHPPGLLKRMIRPAKGTGRVAKGASMDYKPRSPLNKMRKLGNPNYKPR